MNKQCVDGFIIVAFLQNLWVKDPQRIQKILDGHDDKFRRALLKRLLFAGGLTGKRLRSAFGNLCEQIIWDEASREIAGVSSGICQPDLAHIKNVLDTYKPNVVVVFGNIARDAVVPLWSGELICLPHPAARQADVMDRLRQGAERLRQ